MKISFVLIVFLSGFSIRAQYYYNDIAGTMETNRLMQTYLANKVRMVTASGIDANGVKATDFAEVHEVRDNGKTLKTSSRSGGSYTAFYNRFDEQNRLISITDTSAAVQNTTTYQYDAAGRVIKMQNTVRDSANEFNQTEVHQWTYTAAGKPEKMWRTINGGDSLEIRFVPDESGNPGEEVNYRRGYETDRLYYYFDEKNRITDIVRYNKKIKKLVPDIILTYDDNDRIIQKITISPGDNYGRVTWVGYVIWRYIYNDKGLKTKEALFDKEQQLTGKIEYSYIFGQ
ncbi:MAG: RHS repeat domain-containing protein [Bacteroidota bacterium]